MGNKTNIIEKPVLTGQVTPIATKMKEKYQPNIGYRPLSKSTLGTERSKEKIR